MASSLAAPEVASLSGATSASGLSAAPISAQPLPPAVAALLQPLSQSRTVLGVLVLARSSSAASGGPKATVIRAQGVSFEGDKGKAYASRIGTMVAQVEKGCLVDGDDKADALKLMRIRTSKHELIITPDPNYILVVLHDPVA